MSQGVKVPYADALPAADALLAFIGGDAEQAIVAGSLRRKRPTIGDVELVVRPRTVRRELVLPGQLFAETVPVNTTYERLDALAAHYTRDGDGPTWAPLVHEGRTWIYARGERWGGKYRQLIADTFERPMPAGYPDHAPDGWPIGIDVFLPPDAAQWGWIATLRTGSAEFNIWLIEHLKREQGIKSDGGFLHDAQGRRLETPTEEDVFKAAGLPVIPPETRDYIEGETDTEAARRWRATTATT